MPRSPRPLPLLERLALVFCFGLGLALALLAGGAWLALFTAVGLVAINWRVWSVRRSRAERRLEEARLRAARRVRERGRKAGTQTSLEVRHP